MAVYNIALDTVSRRTVPVQIPVRAGDTHSRTIKCVITRAGETLGEGYSVRFECAKPDNTFVRDSEVAFDGTVATYTLANEVLATPGVIELAYFALLKDGDVVETTESFTLLIDASAESAAGESTKPYISQIDALISSVEEAGTELLRLNEQIAPIEAARQEAEDTRKAQETARQSAESAREAAEHTRTSAEDTRLTAERTRDEAERIRRDAENTRGEAERTRTSAEESRVNTERTRTSNETERQNQEQERARAEQARISAESERVSAEGIRKTQETARQSAESARAENETLRTQAESTRGTQEAARESAERMRVAAEQTRAEAESARAEAEQTRASAEATRTEQQAKNNADQAANNAAAQGLLMRVLGEGEYNPQTGEPTISGEAGKMYLVPVSASGDNKYAEWLWIDGVFEKIGMTGATVDPITTDDIDEVAQGTDKQGTGVLNTTGLTYLWAKLKGAFAALLHSHDASDITSGTLSVDRIPGLSASKITSGTLGVERIPSIPASKVTGQITADQVPNLDALKITSGTVSLERLPNIPASKVTDLPEPDLTHLDARNITSGTLSVDRLPSIPASKVTGQLSLFNIPDIRPTKIRSSFGDKLSPAVIPDIGIEKVIGVLPPEQLPGHDASKITSGTLAIDRLPDIPASKVTGFQAPFYKEGYMIHELDNTPSNVKLTRYGNLVCVEGKASRNGSSSSNLIELYTKDPDFIPKRDIGIYDNYVPVVVPGYNRRYIELLYYYKDSNGVFRIHYKKLDSDKYAVTSGMVWMNFTYSI